MFALFCFTFSFAQTISSTTYPFSTGTGASLEDMSSGTTQIIGPNADDPVSAVTNIGFDFWFNGTRYTQFSANGNGLMRLGPTVVTNAWSNSLSSTANNPKISPYWDDIYVGSTGKIHYKIIGTAPSRRLVVEWKNVNIPWSTGAGAGNFQVILFESTGVVEFRYGAGIVSNSSGYSIGLANGTTPYASVNASTHACTYSTGVVNTNTVAIASGRWYKFTPIVPAAPTSMTFTSVSGTAMTVNWTAASPTTGILGYALYRSTDGGTTYTFVNTYSGAATSTAGAQTGLTAGVTYTWKVVAYTGGGLSSALVGSQVTTASSCSGTPSAGAVSASATSSCSTFSPSLSLTGATTGVTGLNYQWQSSPNNSTWTNVSGATNSTYSPSVSSSTYYRCIVGCTPSGGSANSSSILLSITSCYTMSFNTTVSDSTCGGFLYDDGGPTGNYNASTGNSIYTIYPRASSTGSKLSVSFTSFNLESGYDYLYIYNGNSTSASLVGSYTGTTLPSSFTSTAADGSLTFRLTSDGIINAAGFAATLTTSNVNPITAQPPATTNTCVDYTSSLSFGVNGNNNTYMWYDNGTTNSNVGGTATGVTTATFTPSTTTVGTKYYYCEVTTACGNLYKTNAAAVIVNASPAALTGTMSACSGSSTTLTSTTGGGTWSASNALVSVTGGNVTAGATAGTSVISYIVSGCAATAVYTVNATPGSTTGSLSVCSGSSTTLTNSGGLGTWSSSNTAVATVGASTGIVTGIAGGTAGITYANGCGSPVPVVFTVNQTPAAIGGTAIVCVGATSTLTNANTGGTWTSGTTSVATIGATTGTVTGVAAGTAVITYSLGNGCTNATRIATVNLSPPSLSFAPATTPTICLTSSSTMTVTTTPTVNLLNQDFNSGFADGVSGTWSVVNTGGASIFNWSIGSHGSIGSGDGSAYAYTNADAAGSSTTLITQLRSPSFSTAGYASAALSFNYYCNSSTSYDANAQIDYSLDGGATWTTLHNYLGTITGSGTWTAGTPNQTITLPAGALGKPSVMLRWFYNSTWGFYWGVDNIKVTATYNTPTYSWSGVSGATGLACTTCSVNTITPTTLGANVYSVVASAVGCSTGATVTVHTEQAGAVTVTASDISCGSATLTAAGGTGGTIYYQGTTSNGTSTATPSTSQSVSSTGTYYFRARTSVANCWGTQGSKSVTVNPVPSASPTNSGTICAGGTVTLNANPAGGANTFTWSGPGLVATTGSTTTATPTATSIYSLTVSDGTGNPGCSPATVYTTQVTVNDAPTASPTNNGYICNGGTVTLTANPGGSATNFVWSGPSLSSTTAAAPTATPTVTSVYSLTVSNGTSAPGCSPSTVYTTSVTVNSKPIAAPTNNGHICVGGTVSLTANGSGGASTYAWSGPSLSSATVASPTATPTATATYSLTVTEGSAQPGCSPTTVYTTTVTVNSIPTASPTNSSPICVGGTVTLTPNPASGASTFAWSGPALSSASAASPSATPTVTSVYSLTVTDGTGKPGCSPSTVYTTSVTVNSVPTAAPTNNGYICNGGTVALTANPADGAAAFNWSGPNLSSTSIANPTAIPTVTSVYSLTVTNGTAASGCSPATIYTTSVTVNAKPAASPTNNGYICVGGTVALTANGSGGASTYSWSGTNLSSSTIANPTATPTVSSTYSLTVTDGSSQPGCSPSTVYTTTVTVNAIPTAAPTNSGPICVGGTVTLSANPAAGAATYSWSGPELSSNTVANPTATPTVTSVYSLTVTDGSGNAGCSPATVYTTMVTVNSVPTAAPTNDGYICNGGTVNLAANPATGATTFAWSGPNLSSSSVANPTATPTVTSVYSLTVTNGTAASGCSPTTVYTTSVTVNAKPIATPSNDGHICLGGTVNLNANGSGGAATYSWSGPALSSTSIANPSATPTVTSVYSVVVTDGTARSGCAPATVYTTSVTVNSVPSAAPSNSSPICAGGTVTLSANPLAGAATYSWSGPALSSSTVANPTATPTLTAVYSLTVTDGSGKSGCSPTSVYTTSVSVNTTPIAAPTNNGYICNGGTVTLTANPAGGANTYTWSGPALSSTTVAAPTATPTVTSTYSLVVSNGTAGSGCAPSTVYTTTVTVNSTPIAAPTNSGTICVGGTVTLNANPAGGATSYSWTGAALSSTTIAGPTATPTVTGVYSLTVSDGSTQPGCSPSTIYTTSVTVNAAPSLSGITTNSPLCAGASLALNANGASNVTAYSWSGPVAISSSTSAAASVAGVTSGATGNYSVTVNNGSGSGCAITYTTAVTVNSLPTLASVAASTNNLCVGGTVTFTAGTTTGSGSIVSYNWSGPNGFSQTSSVNNISFTPTTTAATGSYSLNITYTGTGCVSPTAATSIVTVNALPTIAAITATPATLCAEDNISLLGSSAAFTGSGSLVSYNWSGPGGFSSTSASSSTSYTAPDSTASGSYTLSVTYSPVGCTSNPVSSSLITVNPLPAVYNVTGGGFYCSGGSGVPIGVDGSQVGVNYQLFLGSAPIGSVVAGTGGAISFGLQTASGTYSVNATNATTLCTRGMSGTVSVSVGSVPVVYNVTGGGVYCENGAGVSISLSNSSSSVGYQAYRDGTPDGPIVTGTGSAMSLGLYTLAGNYTVIANPSSACAIYMTGTVTVSINPAPIAYSISGGGAYCSGGSGFSISLDTSAIGINYQLYNGATAVSSVLSGTSLAIDFGVYTASGTYIVLATNNMTGCTKPMANTVDITINPLPTQYTMTGGGNYCAGGSGVSVGLSGSDAGINYQLYNGASAVGTALAGTGSALSFGTFTAAGTYSVRATNATTACVNNMTGTATVVINPLPVPYLLGGGGGYCAGGTGVHISLAYSELGVNYQLYNGSTAYGTPYGGSASGLDFGLFTDVGTYSIHATNSATGCINDMAGTVTVFINPLPVAQTVTGGGTICAGASGLSVGLSSSQSGVNYQLYRGSTAIGGIVAGTGSALSFGSFTTAGTYTVRATNNSTACINNMSGSAVISVNPLPTNFAVTGGGNYCAGGSGVAIGLSGSQSGVNYQLFAGSTAVGSPVAGTGAALSFGTFTSAGTYTVAASNATTTCSSSMSGAATVVINPLPTSFSVTGGGSYCGGGAGVSVGLSGSSVGVNYQLYNGATAIGSPVAGNGFALNFGTYTSTGTYTVQATDVTSTCVNNMAGSASISISPAPTAFALTGGGSYCSGGSGVAIGLANSQSGVTYQLYRGASTIGSPVAGTGAAITFGNHTTAGTYTVFATNTATTCTGAMSGSAIVSVLTVPSQFSVTGGGGYCSGGSGVSVGLASSTTGVNYQLYFGASAIGSSIAGTGSAISFGTHTTSGTYTVQATDASNSCTSAMLGSANVIINSLPVAQTITGGGSYCAGGSGVAVGLASSAPGIIYQLYRGATPVGTAVTGSGSSIPFGLQTTAGTYTVLATNSATSCTNAMAGSATVVINPLPTVFTVTGGGSYCAGGAGVAVGLSGSQSGINYQLYNGATAIGSPLAGTGSSLSFGSLTAAATYTVFATNATTSCVAPMSGSATVVVNPLPVAYAMTGGGQRCIDGPGLSIGLSNTQSGVNYQLYYGSTPSGTAVAGTGSALDFGTFTAAGTYSVFATNATTSCVNNMTGVSTIIVNPLPNVHNISGGGGFCIGGLGVAVGLSTSDTGISYQLYRGITASGTPVSGTGAAISFGQQTVGGTYSVRATNSWTGCVQNMSGTATVVVHPLPVTYNVVGGGSFCAGGAGLSVDLSGSEPGVAYQLYNGSATFGGPLYGTGSPITFGVIATAGTYSAFATNTSTGCVAPMSGSTTIVINPLPNVYSITGGGSFCAGGSGINLGLSGSQIGVNYRAYNGTTAVGPLVAGTGSAISFGSYTSSGTYTVLATDAATGCTRAMTGTSTIVVNPLPVAYTVTGGGAYCAGGIGVNVGISSSQLAVNYQLFANGAPVGSVFEGTGGTFDFGLQTTAGTYTVMATNIFTGCTNAMSGATTISINDLPIAHTVTGGGAYCSGGVGVTVGLSASTPGVNYQLYRGSSIVGTPLAGTGSSLSFGFQTVDGSYSVRATNAATGCVNGMAGTAVVIANPLPTSFSVTGGGSYCAGGAGVSVTLSGSSLGVNYQLFNGATPSGSPLAGTGSSLTFTGVTAAGSYTVLATNAATTCVAPMGGSVLVNVNPLPTAFNVNGGGNYCAGGPGVAVGLSGSTSGVNYQLFVGSSLAATAAGGGGAIAFGTFSTVGTYTVRATNTSTGCVNSMTGGVTVGINPLPAAQTVTGGGSYCSGGSGVPVGLVTSEAGVSYQLFRGATSIGAPVSGSGGSLSFGQQSVAGAYSVLATNVATSCVNAMSGAAVVAINPLPTVYNLTGGGNYCAGAAGVNVGLSGSQAGVNYQLYTGAFPSGVAVVGTGEAISFGTRSVVGTYTVSAVNTATGCTSTMSGSATVGVNVLPVAFNVTGGGDLCVGGIPVAIGLSGSTPGATYQLYNGTTAIGSSVAGTGSPISFGTFTTAGVYTVLATSNATSCTRQMSGSAAVIVNPLPLAQNVTGGGAYCIGGSGVNIGLANSQSGVSYTLYNGATPALTIPGTGAPVDFGTIFAAGTYSVAATNSITGCAASMTGSVNVVVNPLPAVQSVVGGGGYCSDGTGVPVSVAGSEAGISYQLYRGALTIGPSVVGSGVPLNLGIQTVAGSYSVLATNIVTGCQRAMSGSATVSINPVPASYTVTGGGAYCAGGNGVTVGLSGTQAGVSYQLYRGAITVGASVLGSGSSLTFGLQTETGIYTVRAINTLTGCSSIMSSAADVVVNSVPLVYDVTGGGSYCAGGAGVAIGLSGSDAGTTYTLYNGTSVVAAAIPGTGAALDFGFKTAIGTYSVRATNAATCQVAMSGDATVAVSPLPANFSVTGGGNYCTGAAGVAVGLSGSSSGITYQLVLGGATVGTAFGTGSSVSFGAITTPGSYTVRALDISSGCSRVMSGSASVGINTAPAAYSVVGGGSICAGATGLSIGLSGSESGVTYRLYAGSTPVGASVAGTGSEFSFGSFATAGTYSVLATNAATGCTSSMIGDVAVNVNDLPVVFTVTGGGSYCSSATGVAVGLSGSQIGVQYQLFNGSSPAGATVDGTGGELSFGLLPAGSYSAVATNVATTCVANMAGTKSVILNANPNQYTLTGGGAYCSGGVGVAVALSGSQSGVSYQLFRNAVAVGSPIAGTGSELSFGSQTNAGSYTVQAINNATSCQANMLAAANVVINPLPNVYDVLGGGSYCAGGSGVEVTLAASDLGVTYSLFKDGSATGIEVAGVGSNINFGHQADAGTYTVRAVNALTACSSVMSGNAVVVVNSLPDVFTVASSANSYCAGGSGVSVTLSGSNAGVSYQLYHGSTTSGAPVAGSGSSISFGLRTLAGTYSVLATNTSSSCVAAMAGAVPLSILPLPMSYSVTGGGNYCTGGTGVPVGLSSSEPGVSYTLYQGTAPIGVAVAGTGGSISFGAITGTGGYTVRAVDAASGCSRTMLGNAIVAVNALPAQYALTGGGTYCEGGTGVAVGLAGSSTGITYQLFKDGLASGAPVAGTGSALSFGIQLAGSYSVLATNVATTCTNVMTGSIAVMANPLPIAYTVGGGGNYCPGAAGSVITLSGSQSGINYRLYRGTTMVASIPGTGGAIAFGAQSVVATYSVSAINTTSGCISSMTGTASISLHTLPDIQTVTGGGTYCEGGAGVAVALAGTQAGVTYRLYNGATLVGASITGTGSGVSFGLQSATGSYSVLATGNISGCSRAMSGLVTVGTTPVVVPAVSLTVANTNVCAGTNVTFTAAPVNGGTAPDYMWTVNGTAVTTAGASFSYVPANGDVVAVAMSSSAACPSVAVVNAATTMTVNPNQTPIVSLTKDVEGAICKGAFITYSATPTYGGTAPAYSWIRNGSLAGVGASLTIAPNDSDIVYCMMTSNFACKTAATVISNSDTADVVEPTLPTVIITSNAGPNTKPGDYITFTAVVSNAGPIPELSWKINDVVVPAATSYSFITNAISDGDTVSVQVRTSGPCGGQLSFNSIVIDLSTVSVASVQSGSMELTLMPNPTKGTFIVKGDIANAVDEATIEVTNMLGQLVYAQKAAVRSGSLEHKVELPATLANGMYLVTVRSGALTQTLHVNLGR